MIRHLPRLLCGSFALVLLGAAPAISQQQETEVPPAHVSYSDGFVAVEHDATSEQADPNTPLLPGDRIRTELGRAEILFGDGTVVHLDEHTAVDLLSPSLLRLMSGRIVVVAGSGLAGQLQVDSPAASVRVLSAGEYRVSLLPRGEGGDLELAVIRGTAELIGDADSLVLRAGQRALASLGMAPAGPWPFNSAQFDAFAQWSRVRLDARLGPGSYQYVPPELRSYAGTFDSYGWWDYQPTYGYVWFPRVDHGWRPYYHGRWKHYRRLGWTWIGGPRWAWPTHHYGRWGITSAGAWFWIPGRHWGAAWVHWGVAPGYVSWCPLGFDDRPVFAFWSRRVHRGYDPWRGWTVVRRSHFGSHRHVRGYALDGQRVVSTHGTAFVTQRTAPDFRSVGVSRSGRVAGVGGTSRGVAVPRGSVTAPARRGDRALALSPARRPRSAGVPTAPVAASQAPGVTSRAGTQPSRAGTRASRADTEPSSADAGPARRGAIGRAVPRASAPGRRAWRPEDVPVHRGIPPAAADPAPAGIEAPADGPARRPGPSYRSPDTRGDGAGMAVPRGNGGRRDGGYVPPRTTEGPSRGSVGVPSHRSAPPAPPPSRAGDSGGRERRAPEGSGSGARAVPRGDSGGGSTAGGGGRVGGRSRR